MKLYSYNNPFTLTDTPFWNEISSVPHFCISQTLVQGLKRHYPNQFNHIFTIDSFIDYFFSDWYLNVERQIEQYVQMTAELDKISNQKICRAFKFNKRAIDNAIRFLINLDISDSDFNINEFTTEETAFINIYASLKKTPLWEFPQYNRQQTNIKIREALYRLNNIELSRLLTFASKKYKDTLTTYKKESQKIKALIDKAISANDENTATELQFLDEMCKNSQQSTFKKIVFHGIHQFTPKILRAIHTLEKNGIEIIFLFNYNEDFDRIYETWLSIYSWIGKSIDIKADNKFVEARSLGEALGNILEGRRLSNTKLNNEFLCFDNATSFTNYVSKIYEDAKGKASNNTLAEMQEQFYGVNARPINDILKLFFPEQFGSRHFLAYPIGQFLLSVYSMWQTDNSCKYDPVLLRECLAINIWNFNAKFTPMTIYGKLQDYLHGCKTLQDIIARLNKLKTDRLHLLKHSGFDNLLKRFSFFNIEEKEINDFAAIINDIIIIAKDLFGSNTSSINFRQHFEKLLNIITMKIEKTTNLSEEERELISEVKSRLSSLNQRTTIKGSLTDLQETLFFYLNNEDKDDSANWILRNFEQIDGGILLSKYTKASKYHFALLSEKNMKAMRTDFYPYPLKNDFLKKLKTENQDVNIILNCFNEHKNFLRFSLFYGTYYLDRNQDIVFSYIKNFDSENDLPYYLLNLIGIKPKQAESVALESNPATSSRIANKVPLEPYKLSNEERNAYEVCPYRFMLAHVLDTNYSYPTRFLSYHVFRTLLIASVWKDLQGKLKSELDVLEEVKKHNEKWKSYFPHFTIANFIDMTNQVAGYINNCLFDNNDVMQSYSGDHMVNKLQFKDARKTHRIHLLGGFEEYLYDTSQKEPFKIPNDKNLCMFCSESLVCLFNKTLMEESENDSDAEF